MIYACEICLIHFLAFLHRCDDCNNFGQFAKNGRNSFATAGQGKIVRSLEFNCVDQKIQKLLNIYILLYFLKKMVLPGREK